MDRPRPSVSVIVVTRDRPHLLRDALACVAHQSVPPLEVRIADDGEVPAFETVEDPGLLEVVVVEARAGQPGAARNLAARGARGDVLAFHDDDDRWLPGHLEGLAGAFPDPDVGFAWRDVAIVREDVGDDGTRRERGRRIIARDWDDALMRRDDYLPPSAWGVRRALFERLGGFDASFRFSEDWDFVLRAAALTRPRRVPGVTVEVRLRDAGNASSDMGDERLDCLRRLAERHGFPVPEPKTFWEVAEAVGAPA
jgi:glycosyltransferase involved in cell wall biosynthesis